MIQIIKKSNMMIKNDERFQAIEGDSVETMMFFVFVFFPLEM